MPSGSCRWRHGVFQRRMLMAVVVAALLVMTAMETHASATTTSRSDVVSSVRADSNVLDDSEDGRSASSTKAIRGSQSHKAADASSSDTGEARSLNFQDVLTNTWDLLTTRTLRPETSSIASEADDEDTTASATEKPSSSVIKAESLSLSADDAVTEALKTATPEVTPSPVPTTVAPSPAPAVTVTPVVTPAPVVTPTPVATPVAAATPAVATPVQQRTSPSPTPTPSPSPSAAASDSSSSPKGSLDTDELVKQVNIKSGSSTTNFDTTIVVMIMGGVAVIGVVVLVMSRKISKETGDDEAIRRASSFGHVHM